MLKPFVAIVLLLQLASTVIASAPANAVLVAAEWLERIGFICFSCQQKLYMKYMRNENSGILTC